MIPLFKVMMNANAASAVASVLNSGFIGQGPKVDEFERRLGLALNAKTDILVTNCCTSALDLAYHLCGVEKGSEVISVAQTCSASNTPLILRGAKIVWADVNPITGLIDPIDVERKITNKTNAIVAVDWGGLPCDYDKLKSYGIPVIEDAAHAFMATYKRQSIARSGGDYVAWSYGPIKHLSTPDCGALLCPSEQIDRARLLRWYGLDRRSKSNFRCDQNVQEVGFKYSSNDVVAAIGLVNLDDAINAVVSHRKNAAVYDKHFKNLENVKITKYTNESSWWIYTILVENRDNFIGFMAQRGIETSQVHARNDKHDSFPKSETPLPGLDSFASHEAAVPVGSWLSNEDRDRIVESVIEWNELT